MVMNSKYDKKNKITVSSSLSVDSILGVAFIVLKLCNVINWSWWWVLAPFWIPMGIATICLIITIIIMFIVWWKDGR